MSIEPIIMFLKDKKENEVITTLMSTFEKYATNFNEFDDLAKVYFKLKKYDKAIKFSKLSLNCPNSIEQNYVSRSNLINVYNHANIPEEALKLIDFNLNINPNDCETILEEAYSNFLIGNRDKAEELLKSQLIRDDVSDHIKSKILYNLGTYELYKDNFQKGLRLFLLNGNMVDFFKKHQLPIQKWNGEPKIGQTIIIYAEAGIGDEIINVRFMKNLEKLGMKPVWFTERVDLRNMFIRNGFTCVSKEELCVLPIDSVWTHSMTLPIYLELEHEDLWDEPYLKADEYYVKKYSYLKNGKPSVGIRWQGNPDYEQDLHRSLPLKEIYNKIGDLNYNFYSLQKDEGIEHTGDFKGLIDLSFHMNSWEDTLGIIENLDIVITSCTSIAHVAAAMGKRTYVLVPISAYYTWCHSTEKSPWYGNNITILRQTTPRSWYDCINKLRNLIL